MVFWGLEQTCDGQELHCFTSLKQKQVWINETLGLAPWFIGGRNGEVRDHVLDNWIGPVIHHLPDGSLRYS